jgi:hypothetical protein
MLPSGWTIAESWAALRKSWRGFKIAHSKGDRDRMQYYATFIRKVQNEMGIDPTEFDSNILEEQNAHEESENTVCEPDTPNKENDEVECPDYDAIAEEARSKITGIYHAKPMPRQSIFAGRQNWSKNSCKHNPGKLKLRTWPEIERGDTRRSCQYELNYKVARSQPGIEGGNTRKSCQYELKGKMVSPRQEIQSWEREHDDLSYYDDPSSNEEQQTDEEIENLESEDDNASSNASQDEKSDTVNERQRIRFRPNSCSYTMNQ